MAERALEFADIACSLRVDRNDELDRLADPALFHRHRAQHCGRRKEKPSHGLEQDVNSLRAQRKASEAFAKSQLGKGWCLVKDRLRWRQILRRNDGGFL